MPIKASTYGSMLMNTPALALSTLAAPYCQGAVAAKVDSRLWPTIPNHAVGLSATDGDPCSASTKGVMVTAATISMATGTASAERVFWARFDTCTHPRNTNSEKSESEIPGAVPAPHTHRIKT